jgi:hypothetical protein
VKKLNQKGFGIVEIMLVILLIGLVGGIGYYVFAQAKNNDDSVQSQSSSNDSEPLNRPSEIKASEYPLGISYVKTDNFTESEKKEISQKVAEPYHFYATEVLKVKQTKVIISRDNNSLGPNDIRYSLNSFANDEYNEGFVFGAENRVGYWLPQLCDDGGCTVFPEALKSEYPNTYKMYLKCEKTKGLGIKDAEVMGCYTV